METKYKEVECFGGPLDFRIIKIPSWADHFSFHITGQGHELDKYSYTVSKKNDQFFIFDEDTRPKHEIENYFPIFQRESRFPNP